MYPLNPSPISASCFLVSTSSMAERKDAQTTQYPHRKFGDKDSKWQAAAQHAHQSWRSSRLGIAAVV